MQSYNIMYVKGIEEKLCIRVRSGHSGTVSSFENPNIKIMSEERPYEWAGDVSK